MTLLWWVEKGNGQAGEFYIPTHRDEATMNGAHDLLWLAEGGQRQEQQLQQQRQQQIPFGDDKTRKARATATADPRRG